MATGPRDEVALVAWLADHSPPPSPGETWIGDDTAVVAWGSEIALFATDSVVEGIHFLPGEGFLEDVGWKAVARNVSDVAAMGGQPTHLVAAVSGASTSQIQRIYAGLRDAADVFACPLVGGDISGGDQIVVTVSILGRMDQASPVLRSGGSPGDVLYCTGPLGAASAGLRALLIDPGATGISIDAYRRPVPRIRQGQCAAALGATAMIDVSDGLAIDLHRLADASRAGFDLDEVPIAQGSSEDDALIGGDDYELVFAVPPSVDVEQAFCDGELDRPVRIGVLVASAGTRTLRGAPLPAGGWQHQIA